MARIARIAAPNIPYHVTQRGNRRQQTFFSDDDYKTYLALLAEWCARYRVEVWAYCLMPNHVHLILNPKTENGLARAVGEIHRRYTRHVNFREGWRGHLWQGRFSSYPMDEAYLLAAVRYVELNPRAAKLVENAGDYRWSSAQAHLSRCDDGVVVLGPLLEMVPSWKDFLGVGVSAEEERQITRHERTGRPLGGEGFVARLETFTGRKLSRQRPGPKPSPRELSVVSPE